MYLKRPANYGTVPCPTVTGAFNATARMKMDRNKRIHDVLDCRATSWTARGEGQRHSVGVATRIKRPRCPDRGRHFTFSTTAPRSMASSSSSQLPSCSPGVATRYSARSGSRPGVRYYKCQFFSVSSSASPKCTHLLISLLAQASCDGFFLDFLVSL